MILPFSISTLILGAALLLLFAAIVVIPLFDQKQPHSAPHSPRDALSQEHAAVVRLIRDLDFDHRTGKVDDDDYRRRRAGYVQRGAALLRELDALESAASEADAQSMAAIEAAVRKLRSVDTRACAACAAPLRAGDRFCAQCGAPAQEAG